MKKSHILLILIFPQWCAGYIYQAHVLKKWNAYRSHWQYVIGLGDYHDKKHHATQSQLREIQAMLAGANGSLKVITEDLSAQNNMGRFGWGPFYVNSRGGILGGLTERCHDMGIDTENVEFRYCRVCSLGPVLNNIHTQPQQFRPTNAIRLQDLCNEIDVELDRIRQFEDGLILHAWYTKQTKEIERKIARLGLRSRNMSVADFISCVQAKRLPLVKKLLTFDSSLLDMKMVHAIVHADTDVCAIAGGSHIERVSIVLQKVGYEPVFAAKSAVYQSAQLRECIGSDIKEHSFKPKPQPIDLTAVKKFF